MKSIKRFIVIVVALFAVNVYAYGPKDRILLVVSSYGEEQGEKLPGFEFDELAKAYLVFNANGFAVDIASPRGGTVEADKFNKDKAYNQAFLANKSAVAKLANTLSTKSAVAEHYAAIFIVGGKGAMFDLPKDQYLQSLIAKIYESKGVVSAVCHGPAALVNVKLSNGSYLVAGKSVNGFTNQEEKAFGKKWVPHFEFLLEDKLKERGARFEKSPMMMNHVTVDSRLITGQNPFSTTATAQAVVQSLGQKPIEQPAFKDDATVMLISKMLKKDNLAVKELAKNTSQYQPELIAMYGYYHMLSAESETDLANAIMLMEESANYMDNPKLTFAIAQGYQKLGKADKAIKNLRGLIKAHPEMEPAKQLLAQLEQSEGQS